MKLLKLVNAAITGSRGDVSATGQLPIPTNPHMIDDRLYLARTTGTKAAASFAAHSTGATASG